MKRLAVAGAALGLLLMILGALLIKLTSLAKLPDHALLQGLLSCRMTILAAGAVLTGASVYVGNTAVQGKKLSGFLPYLLILPSMVLSQPILSSGV